MATSAFVGIFPLVLLFGGFSLPLGLPPLPEDPALSRVAPEECMAYASWAGTAAPDAKSANQTEQLLAEPEVQNLLSAIDSAVGVAVKKGTHDDGSTKDVYPPVKTLLTRPGAIFLSKVEVGPQGVKPTVVKPPVISHPEPGLSIVVVQTEVARPSNVQGGAIFNLAEKTASVSEALDRLEKLLPPGTTDKVEIGGVSFHRIKSPPRPTVTWGVRGKYLIVGVGEGSVEGILKRATGKPPEWLTAIRKQLPVNRQSTLIYFNVKQAIAQFAPLGGPQVKPVLDAIGLDNVTYLASVTGLDGQGTIARTLVAIEGEPQGVFRLAAAKPLVAADLSPIPRDATIAAAGRLDADAALELLLSQIEKIDPSARTAPARTSLGWGRNLASI